MQLINGVSLDADRLGPGFYQGSAPRSAAVVEGAGFDTLVLCAHEVQPPALALGSLHVIRCPLRDNPYDAVDAETKHAAVAAAEQVTGRLLHRHRVLVTCVQGINRSGLVSALALRMMTGRRGADCVAHVQRCRPGALRNQRFVEWLVTF